MSSSSASPLVILGAGPYGLSLAAHLGSRGVTFRIFGRPMQMWQHRMPRGMVLKTPGSACTLTAGRRSYTFEAFCRERGYDFHPTRVPVPLDRFVDYGREFQRRMVPSLEEQNVAAVRRIAGGFQVRLVDGEEIVTPLLVVAAGISCFDEMPSVFEAMPEEYISHASTHSELVPFAGQQVTVLGAGASGLEIAALLKEQGADVTLLARRRAVRFQPAPGEGARGLGERMRSPASPLGLGWGSWMAWRGPHFFRLLPTELRRSLGRRHEGPEGGWTVRERVQGKVPMLLGVTVEHASIRDGRVYLTLAHTAEGGAPKISVHETGHVIAATGYRVDLERFGFLGTGLRRQIATSHGAPVLNRNFESSIPGLYFVGEAAAPTFGPLMRFACGAQYCSAWLAGHLGRMVRDEASCGFLADWQAVPR